MILLKVRTWVLRWAVRNILHAITIDDLLRIDNGKVFIGKRELKADEISSLKIEARLWESSILWKLMINNLYWIANFKMMRGANWERDMDHGRMMTLCIDTIQEFIDRLKTLK